MESFVRLALTKEQAEEPFQTIIAAGGDGTLNEVVAALLKLDAPPDVGLGLIPFGTANDFAAATGIPQVHQLTWLPCIWFAVR